MGERKGRRGRNNEMVLLWVRDAFPKEESGAGGLETCSCWDGGRVSCWPWLSHCVLPACPCPAPPLRAAVITLINCTGPCCTQMREHALESSPQMGGGCGGGRDGDRGIGVWAALYSSQLLCVCGSLGSCPKRPILLWPHEPEILGSCGAFLITTPVPPAKVPNPQENKSVQDKPFKADPKLWKLMWSRRPEHAAVPQGQAGHSKTSVAPLGLGWCWLRLAPSAGLSAGGLWPSVCCHENPPPTQRPPGKNKERPSTLVCVATRRVSENRGCLVY